MHKWTGCEHCKLLTYRDLKEALAELGEEQLNMTATVSSGCDANGNAEFFSVNGTTIAGNDDIGDAAIDVFGDPIQPIILFAQ